MRARILATVLVALLAVVGCTRDTDDPPRDEGADAPAEPACDPAVEEPLRAWADAGFTGTVTLTRGGAVECEAAFGLDDPDAGVPHTAASVFAIGSVSKVMTAAAALDLVVTGDLGLDASAGSILPGLTGPAAEVTVEQLLVHTSGLTGSLGPDDRPLTHDEAVVALGRLELAFAPGAEVLYSDAGYVLLALLVEEAAGQPYRDHLRETVLTTEGGTELGGFADDGPGPHWALTGNGDVAMTTAQLARWTDALFAGEVIAPEAVDLFDELAVDEGDGRAQLPGWARFDAERYGETVIGAAGGGGDRPDVAVAVWLPESDRAVAVASDGDGLTAEELLGEILGALVAGEPLPVPPSTAGTAPEAEDLAALAGTYALDDGGRFVVTAEDDGLAAAAEGPSAMAALFPPTDADDAEARAEHEDQVRDLLAGGSRAGREERAALEGDLGPVVRVDVLGTLIAEGELRTYVTVVADEEGLAWYALDRAGGIAAAEITDQPPTLALTAAGPATFRPQDPTAAAPDVVVGFGEATMTVTHPGGTVTARRES